MNIIVQDLDQNNDKEVNIVDKAEFNYMKEDGNDVIDNSEENENEAVQGNIYYQLLENLSFEEALSSLCNILLCHL